MAGAPSLGAWNCTFSGPEISNFGPWSSAKIVISGISCEVRPWQIFFRLWKMAIPYATNPYPTRCRPIKNTLPDSVQLFRAIGSFLLLCGVSLPTVGKRFFLSTSTDHKLENSNWKLKKNPLQQTISWEMWKLTEPTLGEASTRNCSQADPRLD